MNELLYPPGLSCSERNAIIEAHLGWPVKSIPETHPAVFSGMGA